MTYEPNAVIRWLIGQLSADTTIQGIVGHNPTSGAWQVYERLAPEDAVAPWVVVVAITGTFRRGLRGRRVYARLFFEVNAVDTGESYSGNIETLTERFDVVLPLDQTNTNTIVAGVSGVRPVQREMFIDNKRHNVQGQEFEVWAYAGGGQ